MSGMPELGSRISLISKADIRYEGRLFTVDPQECTIALAGVQSFGTEDRETQYPISPQSQIYEYILFRGSDIKDIRVINNCSIPNDPAIMQMHLPSSNPGMMQGPAGFTPGSSFNVPNAIPHMNNVAPPPLGNFAPFNQISGFGNLPANNMNNLNIGNEATKKNKTSGDNVTANEVNIEKTATPASLSSRKSETVDTAVQTNVSKEKGNTNKKPQQNYQRNNNQQQRQDNQGVNSDYRYNNRFQNNRQQNFNRNWNNRAVPQNNRNRFRGRPQGNFGNRNSNRGRNVLKFESDYDFEQANNKFEELRLQLSKLKVGEEQKCQPVNGEIEKKEDSGNETGAGEHEPEDDEIGYDKTKSFFDNISCEAVERSKGKTQRTDWRQERKLNSETFGVSHNRRGNFRPRGGVFYNRGGHNYNNRSSAFRDEQHGNRSGNRTNPSSGQPQQQQRNTNNQK
uniref:CSON011472 protein n=1 Tax=Culicoides sonorensis TaxID=179676 RepID=A0A336K040_CULSO